ncbi:hypothetical protein ABTM90_19995, partial [Acinetobacter baumannii]
IDCSTEWHDSQQAKTRRPLQIPDSKIPFPVKGLHLARCPNRVEAQKALSILCQIQTTQADE